MYLPTVLYVRYYQQKPGEDQTAEKSDEFKPVLRICEVLFAEEPRIGVMDCWTSSLSQIRENSFRFGFLIKLPFIVLLINSVLKFNQ